MKFRLVDSIFDGGQYPFLKYMHDNVSKLEICLSIEEGVDATIMFSTYVAYQKRRDMDTVVASESWEGIEGPGIYAVDGGDYRIYFSSGGLFTRDDMIHYAVLTDDESIDVLSYAAPIITRSNFTNAEK